MKAQLEKLSRIQATQHKMPQYHDTQVRVNFMCQLGQALDAQLFGQDVALKAFVDVINIHTR